MTHTWEQQVISGWHISYSYKTHSLFLCRVIDMVVFCLNLDPIVWVRNKPLLSEATKAWRSFVISAKPSLSWLLDIQLTLVCQGPTELKTLSQWSPRTAQQNLLQWQKYSMSTPSSTIDMGHMRLLTQVLNLKCGRRDWDSEFLILANLNVAGSYNIGEHSSRMYRGSICQNAACWSPWFPLTQCSRGGQFHAYKPTSRALTLTRWSAFSEPVKHTQLCTEAQRRDGEVMLPRQPPSLQGDSIQWGRAPAPASSRGKIWDVCDTGLTWFLRAAKDRPAEMRRLLHTPLPGLSRFASLLPEFCSLGSPAPQSCLRVPASRIQTKTKKGSPSLRTS